MTYISGSENNQQNSTIMAKITKDKFNINVSIRTAAKRHKAQVDKELFKYECILNAPHGTKQQRL
jgi:hypothetical protein